MAIAAVSGQFVATSGTSATVISGTLPNPPTQGNLLVAMVDCAGLVTPTVASDWNKLTQIQSTDTGCMFWKIAGASESATQNLTTANTGSSWGLVIQEFSGTASAPLLVENNQASTTTSKVSPSVSPTAGVAALIVGGAFSDGSRTWSASAFTGSNVGSVTNVGTGSRGAANTGESCTLWYALISSTTGSYTATVTCSAADGGGAAIAVFKPQTERSVSGTQPAATGTLARRLDALRSASSTQPILLDVAYDHATIAYDDIDTYYNGRSPGLLSYIHTPGGGAEERTVTGSQPAATGTLSRRLNALRSLAGTQPASTGTLTRILQALRSTAGTQPSATGTLTRILQALRSVAGVQPSGSGTLTAQITFLRSVAGTPPSATGTLTRKLDALRSLAGTQPSGSGSLSRLLTAVRSLSGTQPSGTGTLTAQAGNFVTVTGVQPSGTGSLTRTLHTTRSLVGAQPTATGTLVRAKNWLRSLAGTQPSGSGVLTYVKVTNYFRTLTGIQPLRVAVPYDDSTPYDDISTEYDGRSPGQLTYFKSGRLRTVTGVQPPATGTLTHDYISNPRTVTGVQPAAVGTLTYLRRWITYFSPEQGTSPEEYVHRQEEPVVRFQAHDVPDSVEYHHEQQELGVRYTHRQEDSEPQELRVK